PPGRADRPGSQSRTRTSRSRPRPPRLPGRVPRSLAGLGARAPPGSRRPPPGPRRARHPRARPAAHPPPPRVRAAPRQVAPSVCRERARALTARRCLTHCLSVLRAARRLAAPLLLYGVVVSWLTWPLTANVRTHLPVTSFAGIFDPLYTAWVLAWE